MSNIIKINKNPDHIKNIHRINRIHGQLKGVEKMIVEKRYCLEIFSIIIGIFFSLVIITHSKT